MSLIRKLTLILPVSLAFFAVSGWAQTAAIEGVVKGPDGNNLQGAQMKIERLDVKGNYTVKTDKRGHYFYGGLPGGRYKVSVFVGGQEKDFQNGVPIKIGETQNLNFDLSKSNAPGAPQRWMRVAALSLRPKKQSWRRKTRSRRRRWPRTRL